MSRTRHTRPRRTRSDPHTSAKKPDEGRRWRRRNVLRFAVAMRDARKLARDRFEVDEQEPLEW